MNACRLIPLHKFTDSRGSLTSIESIIDIPFEIQRVYYLYDIPTDKIRGEHAHKNLEQLIVCISGGFDVVVDNGNTKERFTLNNPAYGLYIPNLIWRTLENFLPNSICLVFASLHYNEFDYYRDYNDFLKAIRSNEHG